MVTCKLCLGINVQLQVNWSNHNNAYCIARNYILNVIQKQHPLPPIGSLLGLRLTIIFSCQLVCTKHGTEVGHIIIPNRGVVI